MANIIIVGVKVPYTSGGQEVLVRTLCKELQVRGHEADIIEIPFSVNSQESLLTQAAQMRSIDFSCFAGKPVDLLITTKFPSYYAHHNTKSIWLVHQHRPAYDLFGGQFSDFSDDPRSEEIRRLLSDGDEKVIREAKVITGISRNVTERLKLYNDLDAHVLYPPLPCGSNYYNQESEPFLLSVGRICRIKRVDMLIKALPLMPAHLSLKIVGVPDDPAFYDYIQNEIAKHHLAHRVEFMGRVDDETLLSLYSRCQAVFYAPYNEDYGYVSLEAMASKKPVVTCNDSGGILEFVTHEKTGVICEPNEHALAKAISELSADNKKMKEYGEAGFRVIKESGLREQGWDAVVETLLAPLKQSLAKSAVT